MRRIYLSPPEVTGYDRDLLNQAIESNWIAPVGPDVARFEEEVARFVGRKHAVALASGTAALHLGLMEAGVGPGDEVLVPTFTFVATANAVRYCGAKPVFVDVDPATWQVSPEFLCRAINDRRRAGASVAAAITVDLYGQCADYAEITRILAQAGIPLVADAAEALGARYGEDHAGSFGVASALSFNGNKIITTSGGGMLLTDDERIAERARHLATQARDPAPHYEHTEVGFNYRLSNLLAAFGRGQLADLPRRLQRKREIRERYGAFLGEQTGIEFMPVAEYGTPNFWLTTMTVDPSVADPKAMVEHLDRNGIEARLLWKPLHLQPVFAETPFFGDGTAERLFGRGMCLPSGTTLTEDDVDLVAGLVAETLRGRALS